MAGESDEPLPTPPAASSSAVRAVMQGNRRAGTAPELRLRRRLHALGLRYRVDHPVRLDGSRPIRPDVVFTRWRVAVFVHGCYWHRCPEHGTQPGTNADYWRAKLDRNVARDRRVHDALTAAGWTVVRVWEHEDPGEAAQRIAEALPAGR